MLSSPNALTFRENSVLDMIVQGCTNREMASLLEISPRTVESHRANIMQKTKAKNAADLVNLVHLSAAKGLKL